MANIEISGKEELFSILAFVAIAVMIVAAMVAVMVSGCKVDESVNDEGFEIYIYTDNDGFCSCKFTDAVMQTTIVFKVDGILELEKRVKALECKTDGLQGHVKWNTMDFMLESRDCAAIGVNTNPPYIGREITK